MTQFLTLYIIVILAVLLYQLTFNRQFLKEQFRKYPSYTIKMTILTAIIWPLFALLMSMGIKIGHK